MTAAGPYRVVENGGVYEVHGPQGGIVEFLKLADAHAAELSLREAYAEGQHAAAPTAHARIRREIATAAMAGWIAGICAEVADDYADEPDAFAEHQAAVAKAAVGYADALIAELNKEPQ